MSPIPDLEPVCSSAAMREADRRTIEAYGLPGSILMENAGRAVADAAWALAGAPPHPHVTVACGHGNNGGDGYVAARVLHASGARVTVLLAGDPSRHSPETELHFTALLRLAEAAGSAIRIHRVAGAGSLAGLEAGDVIVDALLGTGQKEAPRPPFDAIVRWMNDSGRPVVAVDVPTGLDADSGRALEPCVRATRTVTMGAVKTGLLLQDGPTVSGRVHVAEIGIPRGLVTEEADAFRTTDAGVRGLLAGVPRREHKYTSGPALVAAGSARYPGAPVLAVRAAGRAGSGYVVCAAPAAAAGTIAPALPDAPFLALPSTPEGTMDGAAAAEAVLAEGARIRALLVGPGLGRGAAVSAFVRSLLTRWDGPTVVDADGLHAIDPAFVAERSGGRWILTPHAAEFERLGGSTDPRIPATERAGDAARRWNAVVVLKGYPSVVAAPGVPPVICSTGNPALATAGTGDVLAGCCVGFLARGLAPLEAAVAAVHLGGAAADRYASRSGRATMMATDLLRELGPVTRERFS